MRSFLCPVAGIIAVGLAGCSELLPGAVPAGEPVRVLVLKYDAQQDVYRLVQEELRTLQNLRTLEGDAAKMLGGARIVVDYAELAKANPQSKEELEAITYRSRGAPVDVALFDVNGLMHPEDFHSLSLVTTYFNFEQAHVFFRELGAGLFALPVQYFAELTYVRNGQEITPTDNAFWDPVVRAFTLLPFTDVKGLPLGMNVGVVAHEYTHAVFQTRVFPNDDGVPWIYTKAFAEPERYSALVNLSRSLSEGLADFFGAVISGDPAFVRRSLPSITEARRLDPRAPRCVTPELLEHLGTDTLDAYDPYPLGSVLAAALWETVGQTPNRLEPFSRGLADAMTELGDRFNTQDSRMRLTDAIDAIAFNIVADLQPKACGILLDRFGLQAADVPSCAAAREPERKCAR